MADPYTTLGVARGATEKDIKSAYRTMAKECHPDRNADNPKAAERFSEITRAYDLLSDKDKRARFDRGEIDIDGNPVMGFGGGGFGGGPGGGGHRGFRADGFEGFGGSNEGIDLGDIFDGLFGGRGGMGGGGGGPRGRAAPKGANVQYKLGVSLPDAATRATQRITLSDGKTIDLKLPAGVEDGTQMRLAGKGEPGPGGNGDAIVVIHVQPHAYFRRDGDNLRIDLPITLDEAVRGAKVKVPTADSAVMLTIAPGTSSGKTLRLKDKGMTRKDGSRGDQLISIEVQLPDPGSEDAAELARRLEGWLDTRNPRSRMGV
ncbi:J domain-containing protein [Novosphingobium sp.]|uniref:J domain-containing protein n=1 Tax=Novosphingobium sp. TaxID=1874826 RepID=UPI00273324E6|nr:J domain-containing protein [Novosphingobium sp.]MDP3906209.1 J domain-containing protein [Novosphingobium sp.]